MVSVRFPYEPHVGIDLGTTNSCIYLWNPDTQDAEPIANKLGLNTTPSWVAYGEAGESIVVGQPAYDKVNWFYDVKRVIGQDFTAIKKDKKLQRSLPYTLTKGEGGRVEIKPFRHAARYSPQEVSAELLIYMRLAAEQRCGRPITGAVITVPSYFTTEQKNATMQAARIAGLNCLRLLSEPTAAAMATGFFKEEDAQNVLIFDFGGGTFDVTVTVISEGMLDIQSTRGDPRLGGRDLDEILLQKVIEKLERDLKVREEKQGGELGPNPSGDQNLRNKLRTECERAKMRLSELMETSFVIDNIVYDHEVYEDLTFEFSLTRADFEEWASSVFDRLIKPVEDALKDASMSKSEIDKVVIIGGSTRIPYVKEMLKLYFDIDELCETVNPDEGVAYGAALLAGILMPRPVPEPVDPVPVDPVDPVDPVNPVPVNPVDPDPVNPVDPVDPNYPQPSVPTPSAPPAPEPVIISDVVPIAIGIEIPGNVVDTFFKASQVIPCTAEKTYMTLKDNQSAFKIRVKQGEMTAADKCHNAGKFKLRGIPEQPKHQEKCIVKMTVDVNNILHVEARSVSNDGLVSQLEVDATTLSLTSEQVEQKKLLAQKLIRE